MGTGNLLSGPRGRRLCWELARACAPGGRWRDAASLPSAIAACLERLAADGDQEVDDLLSGALRASVDAARYWQDPDDEDVLLADAVVTGSLEPVAELIDSSRHIAWWSTAPDLARQCGVQFWGDRAEVKATTGAAEELSSWRDETVSDNERMRHERETHSAAWWAMRSGIWWSPPIGSRIWSTTRSREPSGPVGLWLVEDAGGLEHAWSWPVRPSRDVRIFEVDGPSDWAELVEGYPLDVTFARGANWVQATGRDGVWLLPDWQAVSADYDAVHLSVSGYLAASGRVVHVGDRAASLIAGWSPDETYWLADVLTSGEPTDWTWDAGSEKWIVR